MKLDKNYKVRVTPEQSREIHSLILLEGGEVSYGLKPHLQDEFLVVENEHDSVVVYYTDQDIFPTIENQEIQADDLIALLTDLLKSAENPRQDMKLTPEFETEASEPKFKAGDKVYIPNIKNICTIRDDGKVITSNGQHYCDLSDSYDLCFVLATPENHALLSKLYPHIEFEQPTKPLSGDALVKAMLAKGIKNVLCLWGNGDKIIIDRLSYKGGLMSTNCNIVGGLTPIDWYTGEPLTEAVLDE